jgi:hypothetical protein
MITDQLETLLETSTDAAWDYENQAAKTNRDTHKEQILCALWTANSLLAEIALSLRAAGD